MLVLMVAALKADPISGNSDRLSKFVFAGVNVLKVALKPAALQ
jgi:hypothetical protein